MLFDLPSVVTCIRCGIPCKLANSATEDARLLKHATKPETTGYCADCAVTDFMKNRSQLSALMSMNPAGKEMLLAPHVQQQFARLLEAGKADALPSEINWQRVYENWDLPFPTKKSSRKRK